jgi:murein DD-endopeptidase MepM/ murein hydrolase activator NlpD
LLLAAPAGAARALAGSSTAEEAIAAVVRQYEEEVDPARDLYVGDLHLDGGWAYAVAQPLDSATGDPLQELIPILARQTDSGWQAIAPALVPSSEFNAWLAAVPEELMDGSDKAFLQQPEASAAGAEATFSGHYLPWPGGRLGTVTQREGSGHAGQIDFVVDYPVNYGDDAIYNTKAGTVVFIKESSPDPDDVCDVYDCWRKANVVVVQHGPEEYSWYVHLAYNSVPDNIHVGLQIPPGVQIGRQGRTGWTTGDHLHYMVSSDHYPWSDPGDPDALMWAPQDSISGTDFVERPWDALFKQESYLSYNYSQQLLSRRSVNGLVRDGYGRLAGGAAVVLLRADGAGEVRHAATDGLGTYKFQQIEDGAYVAGAGAGGRWQAATVIASGSTGVEAAPLLLTRSCGSGSPSAVERQVEALVCAGSGPAAPSGAAAAPLVLSMQAGVNNIYLEWEPTNSITTSQYRLLRAVGNGSPYSTVATTTESVYFDQSILTPGTQACYRVQALQANGAVIAESNADCVLAQTVSLWAPHVEARPGEQVMVPVNIRNARGLRLGATDIWLDYDPRLLALRGVAAGTLARDYAWYTSVSSQGALARVKVSSVSATAPALYGSGALFWLTFDVLSADVLTSPLDLREIVSGVGGSTIIPANSSQPVALALLDGAFYLEPLQAYGRGDLNGDGLVNGADGALAAQLASGGAGTSRQLRAADMTGDGRIDAADASALLAYAAQGNWPITSAPTALAGTASLDSATGILSGRAETTLRVSGASGWAGGAFWLAYDPALVAGVVEVAPTGIAAGRQAAFFDEGNGLARIVLAGAAPLSGDGPVMEITLRVGSTVPSGTTTQLVLIDTALHDAAAQDYATSSLQLVTHRVSSLLQVEYLASFLPRITR